MKTGLRLLIFSSFVCVAIGCAKNPNFQVLEIPKEVAAVDDLDDGPYEEKPQIDSADEKAEMPGPEAPAPQPTSNSPTTNTAGTKRTLWQSIGSVAKWVMNHEGSQVGASCSAYIQRVFMRLGFGKSSWVANDFDRYVRANFRSYKVKSFARSASNADEQALKNYIWSFPEQTCFVFQWEKNPGHGHVAFVQRVQDQLVISHASLNRFQPKSQRVTIDVLMNRTTHQSRLNVFSDFQK